MFIADNNSAIIIMSQGQTKPTIKLVLPAKTQISLGSAVRG